MAEKFYSDLKSEGIAPWLAPHDIVPGENYKTKIAEVIKDSTHFLALFSSKSVSKRGFIQRELAIALEVLEECPEGDIFIIPVRLDDCKPRHKKLKDIQWVDIFPSYEQGFNKILKAMGISEKEVAEVLPVITSFSKALSELGEWKRVHNDAQDLFRHLNSPFELLIRCRYKPSPDHLDNIADKWQESCVKRLKSVSEKIASPQYPDHDLLDILQQKASDADDITEKLRIIDVEKGEFHSLYSQFYTLKNVVFNILSVADTKIMTLAESMEK